MLTDHIKHDVLVVTKLFYINETTASHTKLKVQFLHEALLTTSESVAMTEFKTHIRNIGLRFLLLIDIQKSDENYKYD